MKLHVVVTVLFAFCICGAQASQLIMDHYLEDSFPVVLDDGGITNTTQSSIQDSGSLANETYSSEASYGLLKTSVSTYSFSGETDPDYGVASTSLRWEDQLTIDAGSHQWGYLGFTFDLSGSLGSSTLASSSYEVNVYLSDGLNYTHDNSGSPSGFTTNTDFSISFENPLDFHVSIGTYTVSGADSENDASAYVTDLELTLTSITVMDDNLNPIAATITADSGTSYNVIPEPASALLIGLSAAGFFLFRRIFVY